MATPGRRARTTTGTCNGRRPPREARLRGQASAARAHDRAGGGGRARPPEPVTDDVPRKARPHGQASAAQAHGHAGGSGRARPRETCNGRRRRAPRLGRAPLPCFPARRACRFDGAVRLHGSLLRGGAAGSSPGQTRAAATEASRRRRMPPARPLPWGAGLERRAYSSAALTAAGSARACTWRIRRTVLPPRMALIWRSS